MRLHHRAVPTGWPWSWHRQCWGRGKKFIDIGTDFRFHDTQLYKKWYGVDHSCPDLLAKAVYGLPGCFEIKSKGPINPATRAATLLASCLGWPLP